MIVLLSVIMLDVVLLSVVAPKGDIMLSIIFSISVQSLLNTNRRTLKP
jgi:hypothetical protein